MKTLHSDKWFDVVEVDGFVGLKTKTMSIAVMPYQTDENGMIKSIGLLKEPNPFRQGGFCNTLITGTIEYEDDSLIKTAVRELKEEGGFDVSEEEQAKLEMVDVTSGIASDEALVLSTFLRLFNFMYAKSMNYV